MTRFRMLLVLCAAAVVSVSGCSMSPEQQLIGRWYNSGQSIRFRDDGGLVWNSKQGLAIGRYYFTGELRSTTANQGVQNLTIDVVRNERRFQLPLEVRFLGHDRLELRGQRLQAGNSSDAISFQTVLLKRANRQDDTATGGNLVASRSEP